MTKSDNNEWIKTQSKMPMNFGITVKRYTSFDSHNKRYTSVRWIIIIEFNTHIIVLQCVYVLSFAPFSSRICFRNSKTIAMLCVAEAKSAYLIDSCIFPSLFDKLHYKTHKFISRFIHIHACELKKGATTNKNWKMNSSLGIIAFKRKRNYKHKNVG